jgi:type IV pilus assembly protein PilB
MTNKIDLPAAPLLLASGEEKLTDAPVVARLLGNQVYRGCLRELQGPQARLVIHAENDGASHNILFSELRYLAFLRTSLVAENYHAVTVSGVETIVPESSQTFHVRFQDGKVLSGNACAIEMDHIAIHIFETKDNHRIHRIFIPLAVVKDYQFGPRKGEISLPDTRLQQKEAIPAVAEPAHEQNPFGAGNPATVKPRKITTDISNDEINNELVVPVLLSENVHQLRTILDQLPHDATSKNQPKLGELLSVSQEELDKALTIQRQDSNKKLGEILEEMGVLETETVHKALELQKYQDGKKIGQILEEMGATNAYDVQKALTLQKKKSAKKLGEILEEMGATDSEGVHIALAHKFGVPFVRLKNFSIEPDVISFVPEHFAYEHGLIPLLLHNEHLVVAVADPTDAKALNLLRFMAGHNIEITIATRKDIEQAIDKHYQSNAEAQIINELEVLAAKEQEYEADVTQAEQLGKDKPTVRLVDNIISDAIRRNASDIHIRPEEEQVELVFRIDGSLIHIRSFPKRLLAAIVSRIKILGGMDISERRVPQDGRFRVMIRKLVVDLRLSVMPTIQGESVVIRILNTQAGLMSVDQLGFGDRDKRVFTDLLNKSYGIILVTGPTGSGKSTTLYAALQEIKKQNVNIITIEDPVEYRLTGVEQIQVRANIGFTFARALRNILRHDPDVVMVGEIRDQETGKIAVESALTGHLVLSTLHTNDAVSSIIRLLEMGVEPYLVSSSVLGVLAQRLVKRNCGHCLAEEDTAPAIRMALGVAEDEVFYRGRGCEECNQTGYRGRMAVYELLHVDEVMRSHVVEGVSSEKLRPLATAGGMIPLTSNALSLARSRLTSLAEVYRVRLE